MDKNAIKGIAEILSTLFVWAISIAFRIILLLAAIKILRS
jgi:hypothetical protein